MKRFFAILTLSLAFSLSSNAQESQKTLSVDTTAKVDTTVKPETSKEALLKDITELKKSVELEDQVVEDLTNLLSMRNEALNNVRTIEEKKALYEKFSQKLMGGLTPDQLKQLQENKELFSRLTQFPSKK
jgi:tetrahydromethanopterin S-methyltransferase subunit B